MWQIPTIVSYLINLPIQINIWVQQYIGWIKESAVTNAFKQKECIQMPSLDSTHNLAYGQ